MAKTGRKFMWQTRKMTHDPRCSEGLWGWFTKYKEENGLVPQDRAFFKLKGARVDYVGYVGMGDLDFFRSEKVRKLATALNEDGRVYLNRWSDQTYYVLLLSLFDERTAVGDIGLNWGDHWCHKCYNGDFRLNPLTGEVTGYPGAGMDRKKREAVEQE